jgi:HSP20 family protein
MSYDIIPRNFFTFPSIQMPSIWSDDDELLTAPSRPSGLSVSEDDKKVYVEAALPGVNPNNIEITTQDGYIWIRGEVKEEEKDRNRKFYREATNSFSYRVAVPGDIDATVDPIATYKHGIMTVAFVKSPKSQPKKIQIKLESGDNK